MSESNKQRFDRYLRLTNHLLEVYTFAIQQEFAKLRSWQDHQAETMVEEVETTVEVAVEETENPITAVKVITLKKDSAQP